VLSLSVTAKDNDLAEVRIRRAGERIDISDLERESKVSCGVTPTVTGTERIEVDTDGLALIEIDLSGGSLAPGVTAEPDGSAEIEILATGTSAVTVEGGRGADHFRLGAAAGLVGVNLNPGSRDHDLDVFSPSSDPVSLFPKGGLGPDRLDVAGPLPTVAFLEGGGGNDTLRAAGTFNAILDGGEGRDTMVGTPAADVIAPGRGADTIRALGGSDGLFLSSDGQRDRVGCGGGDDFVTDRPDRFDQLRACEDVVGKSRS
jgi:Ca2+-binding RTX toxin-like protein